MKKYLFIITLGFIAATTGSAEGFAPFESGLVNHYTCRTQNEFGDVFVASGAIAQMTQQQANQQCNFSGARRCVALGCSLY